jgi:hypothetical protein
MRCPKSRKVSHYCYRYNRRTPMCLRSSVKISRDAIRVRFLTGSYTESLTRRMMSNGHASIIRAQKVMDRRPNVLRCKQLSTCYRDIFPTRSNHRYWLLPSSHLYVQMCALRGCLRRSGSLSLRVQRSNLCLIVCCLRDCFVASGSSQ